MKKIAIVVLVLAFTLSCNNIQKGTIKRVGEPDIVGVESDDADMNKAIANAVLNSSIFDLALKNNSSKCENFSIKKPYKTDSGTEHIWISNVVLKRDKYQGIIANTPEYINEIKLGDTVLVAKNEISDWMFLENNILKGGYTIRVIRDKMSQVEKKQFDNENGFIIKD